MARDTVLVDPFGVPIEAVVPRSAPAEEPRPLLKVIPDGAHPNVMDRYREYIHWNLSPMKISEVFREADGGDPRRLILLCEEMLEKDLKLKSVAGTRKRAVTGLYWDIAPCELPEDGDAGDGVIAQDAARLCSRVLRQTNFTVLLNNLLTDVTKPFAISGIEWRKDVIGGAVPWFWTIPATHVRWAFNADEIRLYNPNLPSMTGQELGEPLPQWSTVRSLYNPDEDHPTRAGLGRTVAYYELFKSIAIKDWMAYNERYGMPMRVAKVSDALFMEEEFRTLLREALHTLGTDASAVINESTVLEIVAAAKGSSDPFGAWIDYCDRQIAQLYLGHELSSQSSPGSGQLGITAALDVKQDVLEEDCQRTSATIKRDVLRPVVGFNMGWQFERFTPELYFDYEPTVDLFGAAKTDNMIALTWPDLSWSEQQIRDKYGIEPPLEDDPEDELFPAKRGLQAPQAPQDSLQEPPGGPIEEEPGDSPIQVNSTRLATRRRRGPTRYRATRQRKVDRLAARSQRAATAAIGAWEKQLQAEVRKAVKAGGDMFQVRQAIVRAYPDLNAKELEAVLYKARVRARLYGRNGGE